MSDKPVAVVTGGAGFIGSHMVDALLGDGFAVRVVDNLAGGHRSNLEHLKGNADLACYWQDVRQLEPDSPIGGLSAARMAAPTPRVSPGYIKPSEVPRQLVCGQSIIWQMNLIAIGGFRRNWRFH